MKIGIIDYGASNLLSVANALKKLGKDFEIFSDPVKVSDFDKLVLPGVGAAAPAMQKLRETGFAKILPDLRIPILGICLGLQLLSEFSEEGDTPCLSIIPGKVRKFNSKLKVPQICWNKVSFKKESALTRGLIDNDFYYFVNSFYFDTDKKYVLASTDYGICFPSIIQKNNFYAVQFHPEKSAENGLQLLNNFCEKC